MIKYENMIDTLKVDCSTLGFGPFSVLIVPEEDDDAIETEATFYLIHKNYSVVLFMFEAATTTPAEDAETAYQNAPQYIPDYIKKCFKGV